jgi:hypothetical protein
MMETDEIRPLAIGARVTAHGPAGAIEGHVEAIGAGLVAIRCLAGSSVEIRSFPAAGVACAIARGAVKRVRTIGADGARPVEAKDRKGRPLVEGDPILFRAAGPFLGASLGRYVGRGEQGAMLARIDPGEPRAGEIAAIEARATLRVRVEDMLAELRAAVSREIMGVARA